MPAEIIAVNWLAVFIGTVVAFGPGMLWFSPKMFGARWSSGMNDLQAGSTLFKQNSGTTALIHAGYVVAIGVIMIAAQGIF